MFSELDVVISVQEIHKAVKELKLCKSGGPDLFLNDFFKFGSNVYISYMQKLFNVILDTGYFPASWVEGFIVPLHKTGNVNDVNNYRGVTLLSCLGKIFTRILNNRLTYWAEEYYVYIEAQAGYRSGMSTIDNIFVLHGLITHILNKGKKLYCAFVDFKKAFDFVVRDIIWINTLVISTGEDVFLSLVILSVIKLGFSVLNFKNFTGLLF